MLGGAALESEIAIPQHRGYVRAWIRLHGPGNGLRAGGLVTDYRMPIAPQGASDEMMASARPRAGAVSFLISQTAAMMVSLAAQ